MDRLADRCSNTVMLQPHIVGIGGTLRSASTSELALRFTLAQAVARGATAEILTGDALCLPMYEPDGHHRCTRVAKLIDSVKRADGIILSSPGYHGSLSGMLKNALDYIEDLRDYTRPYFHGRAVGIVVCAYGSQAAGTTLVAMRSIVHALRGWPTPLGVAINTSERVFSEQGTPLQTSLETQLRTLATHVVEFAAIPKTLEGEGS